MNINGSYFDRSPGLSAVGDGSLANVRYFSAVVDKEQNTYTLFLMVDTWKVVSGNGEGALSPNAPRQDVKHVVIPVSSMQDAVEEIFRQHDTWLASR